jgi:hypothetical protein
MDYDDQPIISFIKKNNIKEVQNLLNQSYFDPSQDHNHATCPAALYGRLEIMKLLLEDPRVDPSDNYNYPIRTADEWGHQDIVQLLWKNKRVKSSLEKNSPKLYKKLINQKIKQKIEKF